MTAVKTAISLDETLFRDVDALARRLNISRSEVFARAAQDFVRRQQNRDMLEKINRAYATDLDADEQAARLHRQALRRRLEADTW
jgi:metal-responsive CopG/Arc/MetJ family transcriptional regulator